MLVLEAASIVAGVGRRLRLCLHLRSRSRKNHSGTN
jgi:hypothetical protein